MRRSLTEPLASSSPSSRPIYLAACGYLFVFQRDYVFEPGGTLATPAEKGLPASRSSRFETERWHELTGWYQPAAPGRPTLLYFHGNAGNISGRAKRFKQVVDSGFGLLAMSYRGYPGSGGARARRRSSPTGWRSSTGSREDADDIVVYGESLGTGVAT